MKLIGYGICFLVFSFVFINHTSFLDPSRLPEMTTSFTLIVKFMILTHWLHYKHNCVKGNNLQMHAGAKLLHLRLSSFLDFDKDVPLLVGGVHVTLVGVGGDAVDYVGGGGGGVAVFKIVTVTQLLVTLRTAARY